MRDQNQIITAVVLAGGGGTRLWPISRQDFPKQFLPLFGEESLLQKTVKRTLQIGSVDRVVVVTGPDLEFLVRGQLKGLSHVDVLVEPIARNTAPAIALAVRYAEERFGSEMFFILPSDHLIEPESIWASYVDSMGQSLSQGYLALFGILPSRPDPGYGYIRVGKKAFEGSFFVERFVEKPDKEVAVQYVQAGCYYWNAGMFGFSSEVFWEEMREKEPILGEMQDLSWEECVQRFYMCPSISFDYAILEKSRRVVVYPLPVTWSDVGSWDRIYETLPKDAKQNVERGNVVSVDSKGCLVFAEKRLVSTIGLEDVVVVDTEDAVFVSKRGEAERVKGLVASLVSMGKKESSRHAKEHHSWGYRVILDRTEERSIELFVVVAGAVLQRDQGEGYWIDICRGEILRQRHLYIENTGEFFLEYLWIGEST